MSFPSNGQGAELDAHERGKRARGGHRLFVYLLGELFKFELIIIFSTENYFCVCSMFWVLVLRDFAAGHYLLR